MLWSGARSTTSAAMAGCRFFCAPCLAACRSVLSSAGEPMGDHLDRLGRHGVTHLLGTPTHWRRALMSPAIRKISPRYVRLSGEIADQAILDSLRHAFPAAVVSHAYASTEAGVAFEVRDGLAGFPAEFVERARDGVEMKVLRRLAAHSLAARRRRAISAPRPRSPTETASSIPATWWNCTAIVMCLPAAAAASSISAA